MFMRELHSPLLKAKEFEDYEAKSTSYCHLYYTFKKGELSRVPLSNHTILNQLAYLKTVVCIHINNQLEPDHR